MRSFIIRLIPDWLIPFWTKIAYLIIDGVNGYAKQIELKPDEKFYSAIGTHLRAYLDNGVKPPEAIASTVLNLADDFLAGRHMTLRAGDYISIQNFIRQGN